MDMQKILIDVQDEFQLGGLADGLYADFATEVANRAIAAEREACAKVCEDMTESERSKIRHLCDDGAPCKIATAIRARSNTP